MRFAVAFIGLALGCVAGCRDPQPPQPVRGAVFFRGKPAEGAVVTLQSQEEGTAVRRFAGIAGADGVFRISSRGAFDGVPAGRYSVTIFYLSPEKKADGQNAGPDLLKGKYADAKTTPLQIEVKAGENELPPFRLE